MMTKKQERLKGMPPEIQASWSEDNDELAIDRAGAYFGREEIRPNALVHEVWPDDGVSEVAVQYGGPTKQEWNSRRGFTWDDVAKIPGDYDGYATTFWDFSAPLSANAGRVESLARCLDVPLLVEIHDEVV